MVIAASVDESPAGKVRGGRWLGGAADTQAALRCAVVLKGRSPLARASS
jgi:hypothetical protein